MFGKIFVYFYFELVSTSSPCHKSFFMGHFASQKVSLPQLMLGPNLIFQHFSSLLPDQSTKVHPKEPLHITKSIHIIIIHQSMPMPTISNKTFEIDRPPKKVPKKYFFVLFLYFHILCLQFEVGSTQGSCHRTDKLARPSRALIPR